MFSVFGSVHHLSNYSKVIKRWVSLAVFVIMVSMGGALWVALSFADEDLTFLHTEQQGLQVLAHWLPLAAARQSELVGHAIHDTTPMAAAMQQALSSAPEERAQRIWAQTAAKKNREGKGKLYAFHAPEVECIGKGKSRQPYEFGVKVGIATTLKSNLIVGAKAFPGNPYDGHTLNAQLEQAAILMQDNKTAPSDVFVDLGCRGVDADNPTVAIKHRGKFKSLSASDKRMLKRRQAIEPIIGHLKQDHRTDRCHLKGEICDRLYGVLCAAGYNIKWLLRMNAKKEVAFKPLLLSLLGHGYRIDVQSLRTAVGTVNRWLAMLAVSQPSPKPLRLVAKAISVA